MSRRQGHELLATADEERIAANKQRSGALLHEGRKGRIDRRWAVCFQNKELSPKTLRGRLHFDRVRIMRWIVWIDNHRNNASVRDHLAE